MQGGSLMIFASHLGNFEISKNVKKIISQELKNGFDKIGTYKKISKNVQKLKNDTIALLAGIKGEGKHIVAYSAPAKGNILLNYFGIKDFLDFIVDKSETKQGLYTPGTHLLVYPPEKVFAENPDYLLVLCWNIADEIVKQLKGYHKKGGKFIIPIPNLQII